MDNTWETDMDGGNKAFVKIAVTFAGDNNDLKMAVGDEIMKQDFLDEAAAAMTDITDEGDKPIKFTCASRHVTPVVPHYCVLCALCSLTLLRPLLFPTTDEEESGGGDCLPNIFKYDPDGMGGNPPMLATDDCTGTGWTCDSSNKFTDGNGKAYWIIVDDLANVVSHTAKGRVLVRV